MERIIEKELALVEEAVGWIGGSLKDGQKKSDAHRVMVNCRRKLKNKKFALEGNPAVAMFGESQAGKSYLVSSLLSESGKPFEITVPAPAEPDGLKRYHFKDEINPIGNSHESTSVVTRFTAGSLSADPEKFPVVAKLLSPADIILVLCEAYYNNLQVQQSLSFDELKERINGFEAAYAGKPERQTWITEDDVRDIEDYFSRSFSKIQFNNIVDARFFDKVSAVVTGIAPEEWGDVFALLWNFNERITKLFNDLVARYRELGFAGAVCLPIGAVLRDEGTLLDVERLDEMYLDGVGGTLRTEVKFMDGRVLASFPKSYMCALTAELVFSLPAGITEEGRKPFLKDTDLLDFPGTRRFESEDEGNLSDKALTTLLRRGRVDYLFNKYSAAEKINLLMFCQNYQDSKQSVMPAKLNKWIGAMVGETPEERESYGCPIPPLFIISTWFNCDMQYDKGCRPGPEYEEKTKKAMAQKWNDRFIKVLEGQIIKTDKYDWFNNWTKSRPDFQNIYLLRDFEKSADRGMGCSQLFTGYLENKMESEVFATPDYPNYREDLKTSFINFEFVKRHFANPEKSWKEAADMNKDGTGLIIAALEEAAKSINAARAGKMRAELNAVTKAIHDELAKHYEDEDKDKLLKKEKEKAGRIQLLLDTAFRADGIRRYGQLMKELTVDESEVYKLYHKTLSENQSGASRVMSKYSTLVMNVPVKDGDTAKAYFERARAHYELTEEEFQAYLDTHEIDLEVLLSGSYDVVKTGSQQLAEALLEYWADRVRDDRRAVIQEVLNAEGSAALHDITEMFRKLFKKLEIAKLIAERIRRYTDRHGKAGIPYEIIADISAELLNRCVNTVGFDYLDDAEVNSLRQANEKNNLGLNLDRSPAPAEQSVGELFEKVHNWADIVNTKPDELKTLPSYRNYLSWYDRLKVGFVSVCDIPTYDQAANEKLGTIMKKYEEIKY